MDCFHYPKHFNLLALCSKKKGNVRFHSFLDTGIIRFLFSNNPCVHIANACMFPVLFNAKLPFISATSMRNGVMIMA